MLRWDVVIKKKFRQNLTKKVDNPISYNLFYTVSPIS